MMATKQTRTKIDETKYNDIRYLYDYFVSLNETKKEVHSESTTEIYKKVATILRVGRSSVINCVKAETFEELGNKSKKYKPKKIDEFSQEVIRRKIYQLYKKRNYQPFLKYKRLSNMISV